jgi:hypothetical protein
VGGSRLARGALALLVAACALAPVGRGGFGQDGGRVCVDIASPCTLQIQVRVNGTPGGVFSGNASACVDVPEGSCFDAHPLLKGWIAWAEGPSTTEPPAQAVEHGACSHVPYPTSVDLPLDPTGWWYEDALSVCVRDGHVYLDGCGIGIVDAEPLLP